MDAESPRAEEFIRRIVRRGGPGRDDRPIAKISSQLSLGLILTCGACSSEKASQVATASIPAPSSAARPDGMRLGSEWPSYNGGYDASRYSSLSQSTRVTSPP